MKKQNVFNKMIIFDWQQKDSKKLYFKINNVKPATNNLCPESYIFKKNIRSQSIDRKLLFSNI